MEKPNVGIVVDGYCLGNPGAGGYKGVDLSTGKTLFKRNYPYITNNLAEFLGIIHAIGYNRKLLKEGKEDYPFIFSDSNTAISWVKSQKVSSGIDIYKGQVALQDLKKCLIFLSEQKRDILVLKWETKEWGENPADFGNK